MVKRKAAKKPAAKKKAAKAAKAAPKRAAKKKAAKKTAFNGSASRRAGRKSPEQQELIPGVRYAELDRYCKNIGDNRDDVNQIKGEGRSLEMAP